MHFSGLALTALVSFAASAQAFGDAADIAYHHGNVARSLAGYEPAQVDDVLPARGVNRKDNYIMPGLAVRAENTVTVTVEKTISECSAGTAAATSPSLSAVNPVAPVPVATPVSSPTNFNGTSTAGPFSSGSGASASGTAPGAGVGPGASSAAPASASQSVSSAGGASTTATASSSAHAASKASSSATASTAGAAGASSAAAASPTSEGTSDANGRAGFAETAWVFAFVSLFMAQAVL